ncbi:MAG: ribonucleotide-diphosphate reductase subunit beta [Halobacteriota archaeon]
MSKICEATEIFVPRYMKMQDIYKKHERAHWIVDEADMSQDVSQWKDGTITPAAKAHIKMILRLFTQSDTNVCAGYVERLLPVFKNADARIMLLSFATRETTHMFAYKHLNDTLGYDSEEFMSEFLQYKELKDKHDFMIEGVDLRSNKGKAEYLAKQILMEGVNLFAMFAMLLDFSRQGQLPGMVSINQWSIIDESMHIEGLAELFQVFVEENPSVITEEFKRTVYDMARTVIALEDASIDLCYKGYSGKMTKQELKDYTRFVCDYRMQQMGLKPQFGIEKNPLPFIEDITGDGIFGNFFETTITAYSKDSLIGEWEY